MGWPKNEPKRPIDSTTYARAHFCLLRIELNPFVR